MKIKLVLSVLMILGLTSCGRDKSGNDVADKIKMDSTAGDLEKQKQTLEQKEKQLKEETENLKQQKARNDSILNAAKNFTLIATWSGTINNDTPFDLVITDFDGKTFKGYDNVFAKDSPDGKKFNITGTYDEKTRNVIINEDNTIKGSGKFTGTLAEDGTTMKGEWKKNSGNESYKWDCKRTAFK